VTPSQPNPEDRFPDVPDAALDALVDDVSGRLDRGERIDLDEYRRTWPEQVDALARLLPTLEAMACLAPVPLEDGDEEPPAPHVGPAPRPAPSRNERMPKTPKG